MAFENLGQHLGGYSGQMLQAAIAAREQSMKEKNMRLQAPLALAQTLTGAMGQWQDIEAQKHQQKVTDDKMTMAQELHGYQIKMANEEVLTRQFGNERMSKFLQLELNAAGLNNEELTERIAALRQATQFTKDMQPNEVARLGAEIDNIISQGGLLKQQIEFNEMTEFYRVEAVRNGNEKLVKDLAQMDATKNLTIAQTLEVQARSKMNGSQQKLYDLEVESLTKYFEKHGATPEIHAKLEQWAHVNPYEDSAKIRAEVAGMRARGEPISAQTLLGVFAKYYDPAMHASLTALAQSAGRSYGKTGLERAKAMLNTHVAQMTTNAASASTVARTLQGKGSLTTEDELLLTDALRTVMGAGKFRATGAQVLRLAVEENTSDDKLMALSSFISGKEYEISHGATAKVIWLEWKEATTDPGLGGRGGLGEMEVQRRNMPGYTPPAESGIPSTVPLSGFESLFTEPLPLDPYEGTILEQADL